MRVRALNGWLKEKRACWADGLTRARQHVQDFLGGRFYMATTKIERRSLVSELRAESQGDEMSIAGYAALYNSESKNLGGYKERIAPGAFSRSLKEGADVKALVNHDPNQVLGRTKNGTLKVEEDSRGLKFRCVLNTDSQAHRDLHASIKRGDLDSCSFAFTVPEGGDVWDEAQDENGLRYQRRTLRDVNLMDVSAVCYPAYNDTSVGARSAPDYADDSAAWIAKKREFLANYEADAARRSKAAAILRMIMKG
jgi:HK97 family phage prohead protease